MPEAEWLQEEGKKSIENPNHKIASKPQKSALVFYIIIAFIMGIGGYKLIDYSKVASLDALNTRISRLSDNEKAIFDSFYDQKWNGSESERLYKQEAYDKTTAKIKAEKDEQQKKYDDQAKYEEWMQWQADQELQKKYDDQAKYEEWMKWKADEERKSAEKAIAEQKRREQQRIKDNTISIGDSPSKVERLKGSPQNVTRSTNALGTVLVYSYFRNGYDYSNGLIMYEFVNSELVNITESH